MRLLAFLILGAWLSAPSAQAPPDEAEVYRAALAAMRFDTLGSTRTKHALLASTFDPSGMWSGPDGDVIKGAPYLDPRRRLTYAKPETVDSFLVAIKTRQPLPASLGRMAAFLLVDQRELPAIGAQDGWNDFERRHSLAPGTVSVSRIGFDRSRAQALVFVDFVCGPLCGSSSFVLLERDGAAWRVVKIDEYSVS